MKITYHNILAVICAGLLLTLVLAPAPAKAGNGHQQRTRYAQNDASAYGQNNAGKNGSSRKDDKRAQRDADSGSDAPAVSRNDAANIAQQATGGRVLSVKANGNYWQVKVLVDESRVRFVNVDMRTGRIR